VICDRVRLAAVEVSVPSEKHIEFPGADWKQICDPWYVYVCAKQAIPKNITRMIEQAHKGFFIGVIFRSRDYGSPTWDVQACG